MSQQNERSRRDAIDANSDSWSFQQRDTARLHARLAEQDERNRREAIDANSDTWSTYRIRQSSSVWRELHGRIIHLDAQV